jgi:hypothetical protein
MHAGRVATVATWRLLHDIGRVRILLVFHVSVSDLVGRVQDAIHVLLADMHLLHRLRQSLF